jgi:hypothetical protein
MKYLCGQLIQNHEKYFVENNNVKGMNRYVTIDIIRYYLQNLVLELLKITISRVTIVVGIDCQLHKLLLTFNNSNVHIFCFQNKL